MHNRMIDMLLEVKQGPEAYYIQDAQAASDQVEPRDCDQRTDSKQTHVTVLSEPESSVHQPLGRALRQVREEAKMQQRQSLLDALAASAPSTGAQAYAPSPRQGCMLRTPLTSQRARDKEPVTVIHRHHHHHYHHHYFLDAAEAAQSHLTKSTSVQELADADKAGVPGKKVVPAASAKGELQHFHYHNHTAEQGIPHRAQRLLDDMHLAKLEADASGHTNRASDTQRMHQNASQGGDTERRNKGDIRRGSPDTRLPRLG